MNKVVVGVSIVLFVALLVFLAVVVTGDASVIEIARHKAH